MDALLTYRTRVYFDIGSENKETQRIEIELLVSIHYFL